jgi:excisionase family DNA binding protein
MYHTFAADFFKTYDMTQNLLLLQKEDLKEVIAEVLESIAGKDRQSEQPFNQEGGYYTRDELCDYLHITYTTLWRMEKRGEIRAHKMGRRCLYDKREVQALMSRGNSDNQNK